ncbi:MAG TPA: tetratricopeptide repeat protein, partial [Patescibacteria group bacterium]|nr:tetratricopeptide repeat protein [Patescibacteria group bacterium]
EKFRIATAPGSSVATNAEVWNYLGLACHRAGQVTNAILAYQKAVLINRDLVEARFNLGCLWLEQNQLEPAKSEFTAFTLRRNNVLDGWLKLGAVQFRLRETTAAEKSFQEAQKISPQSVEALNGLGLVQIQRGRARDGAQYFTSALKKQPDYRPALLNLATVLHQNLNDRPGALQRYREYLALNPRAGNWDEVNDVAQALEKELAPPSPTNIVAHVAPSTNAPRQPTNTLARTAAPPKAEPPPPPVVKTSSPPTSTKTTPLEVVRLPPEPVIKPLTEKPVSAPTNPAHAPSVRTGSTTVVTTLPSPPPVTNTTLPPIKPISIAEALPVDPPVSPTNGSGQRYKYLSPSKPIAGNRREAERSFWQGQQAQRANRPAEAAQGYRQAVQADPTYFEAYYNLGLLAYDARSFRLSLSSWENALAIKPESGDARYNFAVALKAANYPIDAASELEKLLAANPKEARAHLVLGNLYAEQLGNASRARTHYQKVLELDPRHPQATTIRYWLVAHSP